MREELDKKLVESFPNLYKDRYADMQSTCLCWGFEHDDGWFDIIWELSEKLEAAILDIKKKENVWYKRAFRYIKSLWDWLTIYKFRLRHRDYLFITKMSWKKYKETCFYDIAPRCSQCKEKFGTLRYYMSSATEEMYKWISAAENKSAEICEVCGKPGKGRTTGYWLKTLCDECKVKLEYKDYEELDKIDAGLNK